MLEDSEEDALLILSTLNQSDLDFEHEHVSDQFAFIDKLEREAPDVILSDYGLKGYNGLAALRDKKELGVNCPFIMVTGSLPDEIAVECLKAGADDYIIKDRLSRLPDAIKMVLNRQKADNDRKDAFSELLKSQKRLEAAEKMTSMGNWEWNPHSGYILWSDEIYNILDADRKTYTPSLDGFLNVLSPNDKKKLESVIKQTSTETVANADSSFYLTTLKGQQKWVRSILSSSGNPAEPESLRVFGTMQDMTAQHKTEMALRELTEDLEQRVGERTEELLTTNGLLKAKNKEMTDSINYAKLIQKALLAKSTECTRIFPKSFVLWKACDIVSGDFYWQYQTDRYNYIAAVDCTGHGVPGALMSMIGHQLLNQVVIRKGVTEPADILQELDHSVDEALFGHTGAGVRDGMDLILCRIDRIEKQICFSGALRPLFHVSASELEEYKGNRNPIGNFIIDNSDKKFVQHSVNYQEGDTIYLTSDGYYSQFGGPNGKKMMKKKFKTLLQEIGALSMNQQYDKLLSFLEDWQGDEEQVDDILIIGIQF